VALNRGIDVSRYQTVTSWSRVKSAGYRFVIIKASERNNLESPVWLRYARGARAAGLLIGSYHFARPAQSSAGSQASYYVDRLQEAGFRSGHDLPPVLDIEDTGGKGKAALTDWCLAFVREVDRQLGLGESWLRCGFYSNRDFYNNRIDGDRVRSGRWWWAAIWPSGQKQPTQDDQMPAKAALWQWTDKGRVPGINENTDLDVVRAVDLRKLAPGYFEEDDMPTFRHYGLRKPFAIPPVNASGQPSPRALPFDKEWADPAPASHGPAGSSYSRKSSDGWTDHELSGLAITGMKPGDQFQVQIAIADADGDEYVWTSVVAEGLATPGTEFLSVSRTLRSRRNQRVRWRFIYLGKETDVRITKADWILKEY
jgi:GH25 family lysozyme M1 (1,4-beta-N-acetylmuramidase)